MNGDTRRALADVADALFTLDRLLRRVRNGNTTPDDRQALLAWIPKQRKVLDEISAVLTVKTPTLDDRLQELLTNPDWIPGRWYIVTWTEAMNLPGLAPTMPLVARGESVTEMMGEAYADRIAHIYLLEDDGSLTQKR